jgi:hypothetical protein
LSDDPETARQIDELARDERPLLVLDIDEVVLEFVRPFGGYLNSIGLNLRTDSLRLHGNIVSLETGLAVENARVTTVLDAFFGVQADWQILADGAAEAVAGLAGKAEIVLLTAMPHRHRAVRRAHLDRLGFPYPLVTTEAAKGPAIRRLRGAKPRPVAFVDDLPPNLISVAGSVPDAALFHLMAHAGLKAMLPPLPEGITAVEGWRDAAPRIAEALGI